MLVFLEFFVCLSPPSSPAFHPSPSLPLQERYSESELRKALSDSITERKIDAMKSHGPKSDGWPWFNMIFTTVLLYAIYDVYVYIHAYIHIDTPKMIWECWSQIDGIDWAFGDVCFTSGPQDVCWIKELGGWNCADIWSLVISYCTELCRDLILDVNTIQQPGVDPVACRW